MWLMGCHAARAAPALLLVLVSITATYTQPTTTVSTTVGNVITSGGTTTTSSTTTTTSSSSTTTNKVVSITPVRSDTSSSSSNQPTSPSPSPGPNSVSSPVLGNSASTASPSPSPAPTQQAASLTYEYLPMLPTACSLYKAYETNCSALMDQYCGVGNASELIFDFIGSSSLPRVLNNSEVNSANYFSIAHVLQNNLFSPSCQMQFWNVANVSVQDALSLYETNALASAWIHGADVGIRGCPPVDYTTLENYLGVPNRVVTMLSLFGYMFRYVNFSIQCSIRQCEAEAALWAYILGDPPPSDAEKPYTVCSESSSGSGGVGRKLLVGSNGISGAGGAGGAGGQPNRDAQEKYTTGGEVAFPTPNPNPSESDLGAAATISRSANFGKGSTMPAPTTYTNPNDLMAKLTGIPTVSSGQDNVIPDSVASKLTSYSDWAKPSNIFTGSSSSSSSGGVPASTGGPKSTNSGGVSTTAGNAAGALTSSGGFSSDNTGSTGATNSGGVPTATSKPSSGTGDSTDRTIGLAALGAVVGAAVTVETGPGALAGAAEGASIGAGLTKALPG